MAWPRPVRLHQLAPPPAPFGLRDAAQRTHERNRVDRFHRGIEPALFRQIADQPPDIVRALVAEDAAHALVGIDNAQQHPQRGGLASAVGAEDTVNRALGHGDVDAIDRSDTVEPFDQPFRLDSKGAGDRTGYDWFIHDRVIAPRGGLA